MSADEATPLTMAERRARARERAAEVRVLPQPEPEPETEEETPTEQPQGYSISDTILLYGETIATLQSRFKLQHATGLKLTEMILQYDINRRHLAVQEAEAMRGYVPPGAVPRSPEEIEALLAGIPEPETPDETPEA